MSDLISRQAATTIPVMPKEHRHYQTNNLDDAYEQGWNDLQECIENLPTVQPELYKDDVSRQAVKHLDLFTKVYCRDESVTNDLVFRCKQCDFEMPDGKCLVKTMARKLCPDYREFGSMGDL